MPSAGFPVTCQIFELGPNQIWIGRLLGSVEDVEVIPVRPHAELAAEAQREFTSWVRPHWDVMARVAGRLSRPEDRDDVLQEALTAAWRKRGDFDPARGDVRTWLLVITVDRARKAWRRRRPQVALTDSLVAAEPVSSEVSVDLRRAVDALPARQRVAVALHYYAGLSITEAAGVMHCAPGTVKSSLSDARKSLRKALGEEYA